MKVAPSILASDFLNLDNEIKKLNNTDCELLHLDVMDGHFVPEITFGKNLIKSIRNQTQKMLDVHLMVENPKYIIDELIKINVQYITIHLEVLHKFNYKEIIKKVKNNGIKIGVAISPNTQIENFLDVLKEFDLVLIMTVTPGKGGQKFESQNLEKVNIIRNNKIDVLIFVDGGINIENIQLIREKKVDCVIAGSYIFSGNLQEKINNLR